MSNAGTSRLFELCEKYDISDDVRSALEMTVDQLSIFKKEIIPNSQTETQREKTFKKIEALSLELRECIEALSFEDRLALDCEYFGLNDPDFEQVHGLVEDTRSFDVAGYLIPGIEASMKIVRSRLQEVGKPGQPLLTERQVDFIRCIAQHLKRVDIAPSYTGPFRELCNTIFEDAGLTLPDRAIRYFMQKRRPELKAAGYCL